MSLITKLYCNGVLKLPILTSLGLIKSAVINSFDIYVSLLSLNVNGPRKRSGDPI